MITLQPGDKAPMFAGTDQNGNLVSLKDFRGRKVALFFYPQDDTPTCTEQVCNLRDNFTLLRKHKIEVIGISPDDAASHKKFEAKFKLPFTLLADPTRKILTSYGVWGEKLMFGNRYMGVHRTTFIIDEKGKIVRIFLRPKVKDHAGEIIRNLADPKLK